MRNPFKGTDTTAIDKQIDAVLDEMSKLGVDSDQYPKLMSNLERLQKLKQQQKPQRISRDTLLVVGGNCLIAIFVLAFEQKHVWTSKLQVPMNKIGKT